MARPAKRAPIQAIERLSVQELEQKIRDARYSVGEDRFIVTFESGKEYSFPRSSLEVDDGSGVASVQVERRRFFFRVSQASGNRYEVPWDRVLHEAEPSYAQFRGRTAQAKTARNVGATIRKLREAKGLTQDQLAMAVGMMRSNISRIEAAKHRPTLETMEKIAQALKVSVAELVAQR
jgi:DNA-binding XRE family transcriptional regulator